MAAVTVRRRRGGPPSLSLPRKTADGRIELTLTGNDGLDYRMLSSDDLQTWVEFTQVAITNETAVVQDENADGSRAKFYRARVK